MLGKRDKPVDLGAKLGVSLTGESLAHVDHLRWEAFHEGLDLTASVEAYRDRYGCSPEQVFADPGKSLTTLIELRWEIRQ
ncbi:hypothetical protein [Methylosarcina fibrata]|uniref:hypothetical protein n=1 Tax=Methylosarcina fibrata TaxID=105972 RepID=UPI00039AFE78|nr:hypothetical protein [Methylosarcina fibrata]